MDHEKKENTCEKLMVVGSKQQSEYRKQKIQACNISKKTKRLDAHSYRTYLKPLAKKIKNTDYGNAYQKEIIGDGSRTEMPRKNPGKLALEESISGGDTFADVDMGNSIELGSSKRARISSDLDIGVPVNEKSSRVEFVTSTSGLMNDSVDKASVYNKQIRTPGDSVSDDYETPTSDSKDSDRLVVLNSVGVSEENTSSNLSLTTDLDTCIVCKHPGSLLSCIGKGCKRNYHLSCLNPPMRDVPPGLWHCPYCVKKKIEFGVHSISEGIETILDYKEGMKNEKHYLVKYKGLAHVHNCWIPESAMDLEGRALLVSFNKKHQKDKAKRWKKDWTEPHRLLLKRSLILPEDGEQYFRGHLNNLPCCYNEWLVKWKDLSYEYATWELENESFLSSHEGISLRQEYEKWHEEARKASDPSKAENAQSVKHSPIFSLSCLPNGCSLGQSDEYLNPVNKIREFWHRAQSAIVIDDQKRIPESIIFILSLLSHTCRPFLIITTMNSLSSWENEFNRLTPSINFVVYNGSKNVRKNIRTLEFYEEGGCILFQVLLSHPEAIVEDLESLDCIGWEAIIIDECQNLKVSSHFEPLSNLSSDFRLLLLNRAMKDDFVEYLNILSFLDPKGKENPVNSSIPESDDSMIAVLKERLSRYVAYERKPSSSKFVEYWVSVQLSEVQIQQYCSILKSNKSCLSSQSRRESRDQVGSLKDLLVSIRKCCEHPYLFDESLRWSPEKKSSNLQTFDGEVNASGKLHILDKILQEMKNRSLRILILFQSVDVVQRISIGDILDDFLRERFGASSYERVNKGIINSKKQEALNVFNDKAKGRFVFLIETRACEKSIKLSSVDAVIIFSSDWNPLNDWKALKKITIDSQVENIPVFRLYSSCTVEEKILIFAKDHVNLESNAQNFTSNICHSLLSWGAYYQFNKLNEFVHKKSSDNKTSTGISLLNNLFELWTEAPNVPNDTGKQSALLKAQKSGEGYSGNILLVSESESFPILDKDPSTFWSKLLEVAKERNIESIASQEKHATVTTIDPLSAPSCLQGGRENSAEQKDESVSVNIDSCSSHQPFPVLACGTSTSPYCVSKELEPPVTQANAGSKCISSSNSIKRDAQNLHMPSASYGPSEAQEFDMSESKVGESLHYIEKEPHSLMKSNLLQLCDTLSIPKDVKDKTEVLLEYNMKNLRVSSEPKTIQEAFIISLCWRAASLMKYDVDRMKSLALAKEHLNFRCNEEEVDSIYVKLQVLEERFSDQVGRSSNPIVPTSIDNQLPMQRYAVENPISPGSFRIASSDCQQQEDGEIMDYMPSRPTMNVPKELSHEGNLTRTSSHPEDLEEGEARDLDGHSCTKEPALVERQVTSNLETQQMKHKKCIGTLRDELLNTETNLIDKICSERLEKLLSNQKQETNIFKLFQDKERMNLRKKHDLDLDLIRYTNTDPTARTTEIKKCREDFLMKTEEFDQLMKKQRKQLTVLQICARNKEKTIKELWLEKAQAGNLEKTFYSLPLSNSGFSMEKLKSSGHLRVHNDEENTTVIADNSSNQARDVSLVSQVEVSAAPCAGIEYTPKETKLPAFKSTSTEAATHVEPCRSSSENHTIVPLGREGNGVLGTEIPSPLFGSRSEPNDISSGSATVFINRNEAEDSIDACMSPTLINQMEFVSSAHESGRSGKETFSEHQRVDNDGENTTVIADHSSNKVRDISLVSQVEVSADPCAMIENTPNETKIPAHKSKSTEVTPHVEQYRSSSESSTIIPLGCEDNEVLETEIPSPRFSNRSGPMDINSVSTTIFINRNKAEDSNGACLSSSLLSQRKFVSSAHASGRSGKETSTSLVQDQVLSDNQQERFAMSGGSSSNKGFCFSQHSAIQTIHPAEGLLHVEPNDNNTAFSHPIVCPFPPSVGLPSSVNSHTSPEVPVRTEEQQCNQMLCSQQTNLLGQEPSVTIAAQTNYPISPCVTNRVPCLPNAHLEQIESENRRSAALRPDNDCRLPHMFTMMEPMPTKGPQSDLLHNELLRLKNLKEKVTQMHENKILHLQIEREKEIEMLTKKYDSLIHDISTVSAQETNTLEMIYNQVHRNQILAKHFRTKFSENKEKAIVASQGACSSTTYQIASVPQPQFPRPLSPLCRPAPASPALVSRHTLRPISNTMGAATSMIRTTQSPRASVLRAPISSAGLRATTNLATPTVFTRNVAGAHSREAGPSHANLQVGSGPRAPAPHLNQYRERRPVLPPNHNQHRTTSYM